MSDPKEAQSTGGAERISFGQALVDLLNEYSIENESNTPDFLLAGYILSCLKTWSEFTAAREKWYGKKMLIGDIKG